MFFDLPAGRRPGTPSGMDAIALPTRRLIAPLALAAAVALTGCTSWKLGEPAAPLAPFAEPPPDRAQICVIRTSAIAHAVTFPVRDGGVLVGATRGPSHFCYLAEPGPHVLTMEADETERAEVVAAPGSRHYLQQEIDFIFGYVRIRPVWVTEAVARELVEESDYQVLVGVPGGERLPAEPAFAPAVPAATASTAGLAR